MSIITFQGKPIETNGALPLVGTKAPDFTLVNGKLSDVSLASYKGKRKVLNIALHEINLKSDISIDLVEHKVNRKVVFIEFLFRKNNNT